MAQRPEVDLSNVVHIFDWYLKCHGENVLDKTSLYTCLRSIKAYTGERRGGHRGVFEGTGGGGGVTGWGNSQTSYCTSLRSGKTQAGRWLAGKKSGVGSWERNAYGKQIVNVPLLPQV